jgi:general stress protein YciG
MAQDRDMDRKSGEHQGGQQKQQGGGQGTRQHQQGDQDRNRQQDGERGGSGNFRNDPERASEAGRKGGSK